MPSLLGPWSVGFPVRFRANGDTVHDAFYKHIQEIERIYGLLNALDSNKLDATDLNSAMTAHINSTNPHPNMDIANTKGNLNGSRITGKVDAGLINGDLTNAKINAEKVYDTLNCTVNNKKYNGTYDGKWAAGRIIGNLDNATIDAKNVTNLSNQLIPDSDLKPDGYIQFGNGFMIQWGETEKRTWADETLYTINFPKAFPNACVSVVATITAYSIVRANQMDKTLIVDGEKITKTSFSVSLQDTEGDYGGAAQYAARYIAIGH